MTLLNLKKAIEVVVCFLQIYMKGQHITASLLAYRLVQICSLLVISLLCDIAEL